MEQSLLVFLPLVFTQCQVCVCDHLAFSRIHHWVWDCDSPGLANGVASSLYITGSGAPDPAEKLSGDSGAGTKPGNQGWPSCARCNIFQLTLSSTLAIPNSVNESK